ncbi:AMP-dependent synthetase/ligase [Anaeromyxobacter diazotrophicus]|uniref:AMP-dependent synthetase n=1 Tax=Anaeromyxobacter diazotrophicus TaxID=2590199 RepID=A0A7I9VI99_9BACT|nr:long-chain fatty acid--CoA ligase [Anaeromyxobacter diazotrophicus]GEJ56085.1 AMP-dependent synthetase [Anaeromyxobacter diazotrophicus]
MNLEPPRTVPALFLQRVGKTPSAEAFRHRVGDAWVSLTWRDTERRVRAIACGLRALGLQGEERCAIISSTRIEWILCDLGILCAGGATTTIYPSSTREECAFILSDSESAYAFVEDRAQLEKLARRRAELPALRHVIVLAPGLDPRLAGGDGWALTLEALEALGEAEHARHPGRFEELAEAVRPDALATLVYTSGTTGRPKGVELLHQGWVAQAESVERAGILDHPEPLQYFWLPLSHVFGKMIGTAQLQIGFPTAVDGRVEKLVENLAVVRPTFVCAVPRIFEKVYQRVLLQVREGGLAKRAVFRWALGAGRERARALREGRAPGPLLRLRWAVADRLVFERVRALFGGRLRFFVSGSAPLSREVSDLFEAAGLLILEGYGLTESSAATHVDLPHRHRPGSVGPALPGVEVKLAPDGEILMRGPWIMRGYHGLHEATAEALQDGWLHTGDVGVLDADGYLTITDRKKDLIKTSGGKYVAPQELEGRLKALSPLVSQVLVHGDRRNYVSALVTLDPAALQAWVDRQGLAGRDPAQLTGHPALRADLQRALDALNAGLPRFANVKRFTVLPAEFSEAAGEVTPSQKLRRKLIEQRYHEVLDAMYGEQLRAP